MDYNQLFQLLNERLKEKGRKLSIVCGGGFCLMINNIRATTDIDAFFEEDSWLQETIEEIGNQKNVNGNDELWLNSSIGHFNKKPPEEAQEIYLSLSHLTVKVVTLEYLLGMKLHSAREKDIADVGKILQVLKIQNPIEVLRKYGAFHIDSSNVLWAFELAYGEDFLREYMLEHKEELEMYFR